MRSLTGLRLARSSTAWVCCVRFAWSTNATKSSSNSLANVLCATQSTTVGNRTKPAAAATYENVYSCSVICSLFACDNVPASYSACFHLFFFLFNFYCAALVRNARLCVRVSVHVHVRKAQHLLSNCDYLQPMLDFHLSILLEAITWTISSEMLLWICQMEVCIMTLWVSA